MSDDLRESALEYHRLKPAGKIQVVPTKPLANQRDLALAYSPGVAAACDAIVNDPNEASTLTARGNLVAVITNGTAVLGLGAIGPLAAKPVMEGKGVLFKKFAGIDVFDIEIDERDPDKLVDIIASLEPTFGGINLEDIKSPECFEIEAKLKKRMKIPVFHDDQHGTAIITAAAVLNALRVVEKDIAKVRMAVSGAGAAAIACLDLLVSLGMSRENILICDSQGVVYEGRSGVSGRKVDYAPKSDARSLADAVNGADIFLGLSVPGVLTPEMLKTMADQPIVMAMSNPTPEILPEIAKAARPDCIMATGRSDYPNQVNNVLCFPFIFRGALDVGATTINEEMKLACVHAIADLAMAEASEVVANAYRGEKLRFGPDYLIPKPFDPRLVSIVSPAVALAAMHSGVATRPIEDIAAYRAQLEEFVFASGLVMKPLFAEAKADPKRIVYAEGEEERVLRAVQTVIDDGLAKPIILGRREVVKKRIQRANLRMRIDVDFELADPEDDPRYREYWQHYHKLMERKGVSPDEAKTVCRTQHTTIAALMVARNDADAVLCGSIGQYQRHIKQLEEVLGKAPNVHTLASLNVLITQKGTFFLCDTYVNHTPSAQDIMEMTLMAADEVRRFGITPKIALLSHSNFGSAKSPSAEKMREAMRLLRAHAPNLEVEGEMQAHVAIDQELRERIFPNSKLTGQANMLVMPDLDAGNIAFNMVRALTNATTIGPILLGLSRPAHVLGASASYRAIMNMSALASVAAQKKGLSE